MLLGGAAPPSGCSRDCAATCAARARACDPAADVSGCEGACARAEALAAAACGAEIASLEACRDALSTDARCDGALDCVDEGAAYVSCLEAFCAASPAHPACS